VLATTILWASIILPITPPVLLAEAIRVGLIPICSAEILCKLPNNTLDAVSEPVRATPSHPRRVPKNGYRKPVLANVNPNVASNPEYLVVNPSASMAAMVKREKRTVLIVRKYRRNVSDIEYPISMAQIPGPVLHDKSLMEQPSGLVWTASALGE
jgi:hypothetical protein